MVHLYYYVNFENSKKIMVVGCSHGLVYEVLHLNMYYMFNFILLLEAVVSLNQTELLHFIVQPA